MLFFVIILPSTSSVPFSGSNRPRITSIVVVLPDPVVPTNPTVDLARIFKLISFKVVFNEFG